MTAIAKAIASAIVLALLLAARPALALDYQTFDSGGCRIAYAETGAGEPLILLHGFASTFEKYRPLIADELGKGFRVVGIDLRGHGQSCKPHDESAYGKRFATDVLALMDRLRVEQAHVVGHSMGGIAALYLAANHPGRFRSVVTIGNGLFQRRELGLIGWLMHGKFVWTHVKRFFGAATDPFASMLAENDEAALLPAVKSLDELTVTEAQAAAIKLPVMAARGGPEDDPRDTVERLKALNPSVEMLRIETEDHLSILSNDRFRAALKAFLSRKPAG